MVIEGFRLELNNMNMRTRSLLKRVAAGLAIFKTSLEWFCECEAKISSLWACAAHKRLMAVQWGIPPQPENFDHQIDLFYWWQKSRNPQWVERGVYGALSLHGGKVLELCCGDGFNARNFYSLVSESVVACDIDPHILKTRKNHG